MDDPLKLRYLQTLNSISAENNSTIIFPVPDIMSSFMQNNSINQQYQLPPFQHFNQNQMVQQYQNFQENQNYSQFQMHQEQLKPFNQTQENLKVTLCSAFIYNNYLLCRKIKWEKSYMTVISLMT